MPSLILLVPQSVQDFWSQFPEVRNNAYKYFNYDRRVVQETVPRGGQAVGAKTPYRGPEDLCNANFDDLVKNAQTRINPILAKYSQVVACEDALHTAIRDFAKGYFDNKINANRFAVLLKAMMVPSSCPMAPVMAEEEIEAARKKKEKAPESKRISPTTLTRQLGLTPLDIPQRARIRKRTQAPTLVREKGQVIIQSTDQSPIKEAEMLKNAKQYTERLDKIAEELQTTSPEIALQIDMVSDVIEGRREASSLKFDPDEARYMANRFDYRVRARNADEPYMDKFNASNFEQTINVKRSPVPVVGAAPSMAPAPMAPAAPAPEAAPMAPEAAPMAPEAPEAAPMAPMASAPYRKIQ